MLALFRKYETLIRYLFIGGLTTLVNIVVFFILNAMHMPILWANTVAWLVSVIFAFFTNKSVVFQSQYTNRRRFIQELVAFFVLRALSLILDNGIMCLGITAIGLSVLLVKLVSQVVVIVANYVFSKLIFKS
ncbi:GtrA family protein [Lacticaseibacillus saniviri]